MWKAYFLTSAAREFNTANNIQWIHHWNWYFQWIHHSISFNSISMRLEWLWTSRAAIDSQRRVDTIFIQHLWCECECVLILNDSFVGVCFGLCACERMNGKRSQCKNRGIGFNAKQVIIDVNFLSAQRWKPMKKMVAKSVACWKPMRKSFCDIFHFIFFFYANNLRMFYLHDFLFTHPIDLLNNEL